MSISAKKMETEDPILALDSPSVHVRASATRDLEKYGDLSSIEKLVVLAKDDPSPAIRHNAADAVSDILSRYRQAPKASELSNKERKRLLADFLEISPGRNNAVFMIYACLGLKECLDQILAGFKDPRSEVRLGASIGLLRYCQSSSVHGMADVEEKVVAFLGEKNLTVDTTAHIARVCAAVGFKTAIEPLRRIDIQGVHGETINAAQDQLSNTSLYGNGIWISDGTDAGEFNINPEKPAEVCAITSDGACRWSADTGEWTEWDCAELPVRHMWFRRVGEPTPGPAMQIGGRTWYMANKKSLDDILKTEARLPEDDSCPPLKHLARALTARCDKENAKELRDIGLLWLRADEYTLAAKSFSESIQAKRTPIDTWFYLGECSLALGNFASAREAWGLCLEKTRAKTSALAQLCKTRLEMKNS